MRVHRVSRSPEYQRHQTSCWRCRSVSVSWLPKELDEDMPEWKPLPLCWRCAHELHTQPEPTRH